MFFSELESVKNRFGIESTDMMAATVLVLPENIDSASDASSLVDASESIELAKFLKSKSVNCKTAADLKCNAKVRGRHGVDIWLGVVWIVEQLAAPVVVALITTWLTTRRPAKEPARVHVDLRIERPSGTSQIKFSGDVDDFLKIAQSIQTPSESPVKELPGA
jgi:hypothetical protein